MSGKVSKLGVGGSWWIGVGFFLMLLAPGLWLPALPNVLDARGIKWVMPFAFAVGPMAALVSPLIFGSMADYRYSAQKLAGTISIVGAGFLGLAFFSLYRGWGPWAYLAFQTLNAFIAAPMWALLSTVTLTNVGGAGRKFPLFRVWGTVGWIVGGVMVSWLDLDSSPVSGMAAAGVRVVFGLVCFLMPETAPQGKPGQGKPSWRKYLGLEAGVLFKDRRMFVFLTTSVIFAVPLAAFYMYAPIQLKEMGDGHPTASMSLGQVAEIFALLLLAGLIGKGRIKWVLTASMLLGLARYALFAYADWTDTLMWMWIGVALHGPCYTFYYVTAQMLVDRRIDPGMRNQAQALLSTLSSCGALVGSLLCGYYFSASDGLPHDWVFFWGGLTLAVLVCTVYFVDGYDRGS